MPLRQHAAQNYLFEMHILSSLGTCCLRRKWTVSLHLLLPTSVCVSSLSVKYPFFLSPCLSHKHTLTMAGISIFPLPLLIHPSLQLSVLHSFFFPPLRRLYLPLNLPSFFCTQPFPTSHKAMSWSVLRCIYYRGLVHECLHAVRVKVTRLCITPSSHPALPKHSLTLYCLWSCFIMSSYMHIIEACPTQAAWLRWNIWIIYYLQSALPHFRKFSQQSRKIIHAICIFGKGGVNQAKSE